MSPPPDESFEVRHHVIDDELIEDALRLLHLDVLQRGLLPDELASWLWSANWFPHLRADSRVTALANALPAEWRTGTRCEPQILLQFPHTGPVPQITFHRDREPAWAHERCYTRIVGVPLGPWRRHNGGLLARLDDETIAIELDRGDAVMMTPALRHSGGINVSGTIRYGVYFRWLSDEAGTNTASEPGGHQPGLCPD